MDKQEQTINGMNGGEPNTKKHSKVRAPLIEAMEAYHALDMAPYHTPGHKHGVTVHPSMRTMLTEKGLQMDVSLMSALDDLNDPEGCLLEAEQMAANLYGAEDAFFAVNGTTGAIHAMRLASVRAGDKIIVPRTAHRSVIGGIILADAMPVWVRPEVDDMLGLAHGTSPEAYLTAIKAHPDAKAVFVVNPTYYGACGDIREIVRLAHEHGMAVLVDEAHGPHLIFADDLPISAMEA
ncbi:MAG: aminotransferase class I/II-fold pyridoxal phosphate-dependent enzyme, partial [Selenomonadales bacterium]|nr:aminotransferase class I/II-fold pyridoxal phosphate-dependent enzyme [Selenomonadales bacterium]